MAVITCRIFVNIHFEDPEILQKTNMWGRGLILFIFPLSLSVSIVVGLLLGFQSYLIIKEQTTLEYYASKPRTPPWWRRVIVKVRSLFSYKQDSCRV